MSCRCRCRSPIPTFIDCWPLTQATGSKKSIETARQCPHRPGISNINAAYASWPYKCQLSWGETKHLRPEWGKICVILWRMLGIFDSENYLDTRTNSKVV